MHDFAMLHSYDLLTKWSLNNDCLKFIIEYKYILKQVARVFGGIQFIVLTPTKSYVDV